MNKGESKAKLRFFSALSNIFVGEVGEKLEGDSGYINLMKFRNHYFKQIKPIISTKIDEEFGDSFSAQDDLYNKLFTFFESYLNETGTPFYYKTQLHKNLYEKVYSDKEDVNLFWKTEKLFYVKSEATYTTVEMNIDGVNIEFNAKNLEHQKNNEKKEIAYHLVEISDSLVRFDIRYKDNSTSKFDLIKKYLNKKNPDSVRDDIYNNLNQIDHPKIVINKNKLNLESFSSKTSFRPLVNIINTNDVVGTVIVDLSLTKIEEVEKYIAKENLDISVETIKKAIFSYQKQNEVDYFIHKNAEKFLKEQFNIYIYNYLFNETSVDNIWETERLQDIQKIKKIGFFIISLISKFENELRDIWLKPKFVKNSNYVFTLDKLSEDIELVEKILSSEGFNDQIDDWNTLHSTQYDDEGNVIKKEWKEFSFVSNLDQSELLIDIDGNKKINQDYLHLPIDTKFFPNLKSEILSSFDNIDENINGILIKSDNFQALNTINQKYKEKVDLIYIDPPFNTGNSFDYKDKFQDSTWLTIMENRLELIKNFLSKNASIFVHLDTNSNYLGRLLLNKIFDKNKLVNEIIWQRTNNTGSSKALAKKFSNDTDTIYFYKNTNDFIFNRLYREYGEDYLDRFKYSDNDGRKYRWSPMKTYSSKKYDELEKQGMIRWGENARYPDVKQYMDELKGIPMNNLWNDIFHVNPMALEGLNFETQKPEELMMRIIQNASNPNSWVMDFFSGSGTTIATAHKLGRKWIGVEMGEHFNTINIPRMKKVLAGDKAGISEDVKWSGGGFFKYYELEQYEDTLRKAKYIKDNEDLFTVFYDSEKLLESIQIENENVKINFEEIYNDVDVAETISNLTGHKIKKFDNSFVTFENDSRINLDNIMWVKHKYLKPLIWWGDKNEEK
ncbi:Modification methylase MboII [Paraliobacillus sp. PM-2]|uniref:site-specific DNA-methyltransferase n=1 Tax=Paraliobacillus sp. PM-2 TaxID=1462524 RepID=UPI00061CC7AF|nr:DNA methyltransferase [Paraliobacillus sp. PM-2]CQR46579.1 Modification methylase MboII [Paraliobacillus sp. PM-2]